MSSRRTPKIKLNIWEELFEGLNFKLDTNENWYKIDDSFSNLSDELQKQLDEFIDKYNDQIAGNTNLDEVIDARHSNVTHVTYKVIGERLDHIESTKLDKQTFADLLLKCCETVYYRTLQDDHLRVNYAAETVGTVAAMHDHSPGLIIAEIGNKQQDRFKFEKIGVIV